MENYFDASRTWCKIVGGQVTPFNPLCRRSWLIPLQILAMAAWLPGVSSTRCDKGVTTHTSVANCISSPMRRAQVCDAVKR